MNTTTKQIEDITKLISELQIHLSNNPHDTDAIRSLRKRIGRRGRLTNYKNRCERAQRTRKTA